MSAFLTHFFTCLNFCDLYLVWFVFISSLGSNLSSYLSCTLKVARFHACKPGCALPSVVISQRVLSHIGMLYSNSTSCLNVHKFDIGCSTTYRIVRNYNFWILCAALAEDCIDLNNFWLFYGSNRWMPQWTFSEDKWRIMSWLNTMPRKHTVL